MKIRLFLLESIQLPGLQCYPFTRNRKRQIEEQRQVGLQVAMNPVFEIVELVPVKPSAAPW